MAPGGPDEAQLQGILDAINLFITAKASETDAVIHLLGAVLMPYVQHNEVFSAVKQKTVNTQGRPDTSVWQDPERWEVRN